MAEAAIIHQLKIERFRGIETLKWNPAPGMNLIIGGGDVGKTTILDAIALLLSPSNSMVLSEADYWQRNTVAEFLIRAVISLPASTEIGQQQKFSWPWEWNGSDAVPPVAPEGDSDDIPDPAQPVYCLQVRGSPDLEISWEVLQPNDEIDPLSTVVRRKIGIVRLSGDDRNDRDLRLVYGSALDRLLADKGLRARIGQRLSETDLQENLSEDARNALRKLDDALKKEALPHNLELGLTSSQGLSIGALTGLLAEQSQGVLLPLASWGAGTRRMATLQVAAATESETRITVVDEIERGLEPYRVRKLVESLQAEAGQSFVTTHSPVAICAANAAHLWYLDSTGKIGALPRTKIAKQQDRDPETFLAKLAVICEGQTEIGFVRSLLERAIDGSFRDHGIYVANGEGNDSTLSVLEAMADAGLAFAGFADNEGISSGRWSALKAKMNEHLFQWADGCLEENIIKLVDEDKLIELLKDEDGDLHGDRLRTLADRLECADKNIQTLLTAVQQERRDLRTLIVEAATGNNDRAPQGREKEWKAHAAKWFKSTAGGRELATKMFALGVWPALKDKLLPFLNAIRTALKQAELQDVAHE